MINMRIGVEWKSIAMVFFIAAAAVLVGWNIKVPSSLDSQNVGITISELKAQDLEGHVSVIRPAKSLKPIVLYIFNPDCHWCDLNLENIKSLADKEGNSFSFIGLSLAHPKLRDYIASNNIDFPVYVLPSYNALMPIAVYGTPQTLVVLPNGRVTKNWIGAYSGPQRKDVEAYFLVTLPGLATHGQEIKLRRQIPRGSRNFIALVTALALIRYCQQARIPQHRSV